MCTLGGAGATAKGIGTIGDGHSENGEVQVECFGVFIAPFLLAIHPLGRVKTPALPTDGCSRVVLCQRGGHI